MFEQFGWYYEFSFKYVKNEENITGEIQDKFGKATFKGVFRGTDFVFLKYYYAGRSAGCKFMYDGTYDKNENKVSGKWYSPEDPLNNGKFWIESL